MMSLIEMLIQDTRQRTGKIREKEANWISERVFIDALNNLGVERAYYKPNIPFCDNYL